MLKGKKILLGVTGGIAAYKAAQLVREFKKAGAEVRVVMTDSAKYFISPVTLAALSQNEVIIETFPELDKSPIKSETWHIELGMWADIYLIAPATANTIAKITYGIADNPVTIMALSVRCSLVIFPAMDTFMWENKATQENISKLIERGIKIIEPDIGELASGLKGKGRLPEIKNLVKAVNDIFEKRNIILKGKKVLVTAGPTYEPIDPVRFIGNRSSGKMGFALARAAANAGANVILISGHAKLETPINVNRINVETAHQMFNKVKKYYKSSDIIIMAAAVSDFSPTVSARKKIKKEKFTGENLQITLKKNPDILEYIGRYRSKKQFLIGFALETDNGLKNAKEKLRLKNLDMIVLNNPLVKGAGFDVDTNIVTIIFKDGKIVKLRKMSKELLAERILRLISEKI